MQVAEQRDSRRIRLRGCVGAHEFLTVLDRVTAGPDPVLDFSDATHIDFRAARDFARQLRSVRRHACVVGLDDYCAQILRFAWTSEDWERLQVAQQETGLLAEMANAEPISGLLFEAMDTQMFAGACSDATTESRALFEAMATWTDGDWETVWSCS